MSPRSTPTQPADEELSYEAARDELVDVVRRLEAGGVTLEESLALWERGERLATICQRWLDGARARLQAAAPDNAEGSADDEELAELHQLDEPGAVVEDEDESGSNEADDG